MLCLSRLGNGSWKTGVEVENEVKKVDECKGRMGLKVIKSTSIWLLSKKHGVELRDRVKMI